MWSPPNFSRYAPARTKATIASPTTPAAGTTAESVRSRSAWAGSRGAMSTERGGLGGGGGEGGQRLGGRGERLHRGAHHERLAGRHAALEAAGAVRLAVEAALALVEDLVVRPGARAPGDGEAVAERDALARLDRAQRAGEAAIEALLPAHVRPDAGDDAERDHLEHPADR